MKKLILLLAFSGIVGLTSAVNVVIFKTTVIATYGDGGCCKKGAECKSACCKMVDGKMICEKKDASCCSKDAKAECKKGDNKSCCHKNDKKEASPKK